jgi:hypothetical protein
MNRAFVLFNLREAQEALSNTILEALLEIKTKSWSEPSGGTHS